MNKKKKEVIIIMPSEMDKKIKDMPEEVRQSFEKAIDKLQKGDFSDSESMQKVETELLCPECESKNVLWLQGVKSKEVDFNCFDCKKSCWMTEKEYLEAVKKYPECIFKRRDKNDNCKKNDG